MDTEKQEEITIEIAGKPNEEKKEDEPIPKLTQPAQPVQNENIHKIEHPTNATSINKDEDTLHPEPHSIFKSFKYPKTGGRLGRNILLWGDELKSTYFPFICLLGPDWPYTLLTYGYIIFVSVMNLRLILASSKGYIIFTIDIVIAFISLWILLTTTLSNPGILFRGQPPSFKEPITSTCRICEIERPRFTYHCSTCGVCCLKLDHHCPWMGKCVAKNTLVLFYVSVGIIFASIFMTAGIALISGMGILFP